MKKKVILIILDGWGITDEIEFSAIAKAKTPFYDSLVANYPYFQIGASGTDVGLPEGVMGNSEVGHINIGAGKVVLQSLSRINESIQSKSFFDNETLTDALYYAKQNNGRIHFLGLLSDGGIHSHINHLKSLCQMACKNNIAEVFIHAITDGRDTPPKSAKVFLKDIEEYINKLNERYNTTKIGLATIIGRFYAMDRDNRWDRTEVAYKALVNAEGTVFADWSQAIVDSYDNGVTDEFIRPIILNPNPNLNTVLHLDSRIKRGDVVINFNFRTDRVKQITRRLLSSIKNMPQDSKSNSEGNEYNLNNPLALYYVSFTNYEIPTYTEKEDRVVSNIKIVFKDNLVRNTLGELISKNGLKQVRIAETEKYPHITYFFSGGREAPFPGETRILCPSPKVKTYDMKPEMSAYQIRDEALKVIQEGTANFICINFANPDMVGHTGNIVATIKACEVVDECVRDIVLAAKANYDIIVTADHGNAEKVLDVDGKPYTAHTTNKVPLIIISEEAIPGIESYYKKSNKLKLADIAPLILKILQI